MIWRFSTFALSGIAALGLAACAEGNMSQGSGGGLSAAEAERACRNAMVDFQSSNDVVVLGSEPYQGGGRYVRVGVGQSREVWQCIAYADGSTGELQYLSEGTATQLPSDTSGRPMVGSEYDLTEFQGARAGQAEGGIRALGYEAVRSQGLTTYWFNRSTGACAEITTSNGRYSSVRMLSAEDC